MGHALEVEHRYCLAHERIEDVSESHEAIDSSDSWLAQSISEDQAYSSSKEQGEDGQYGDCNFGEVFRLQSLLANANASAMVDSYFSLQAKAFHGNDEIFVPIAILHRSPKNSPPYFA